MLRFKILISLFLVVPVLAQKPKSNYEVGDTSGKPLIISPTKPSDSLGEVVYELQGAEQTNISAVAGIHTNPVPLKIPFPKYPKSLKKSHTSQSITVTAVIAQSGRLIDIVTPDDLAADVRKSVLDVLPRYQFKPGTLDGNAIAIQVKLQINFKIS